MRFRALRLSLLLLCLTSRITKSDTTRWKQFEKERNDGWVNTEIFQSLPSPEIRNTLLAVRNAPSYWVPKNTVDIYLDPFYRETFESSFQRTQGMQTEIFFVNHPSADQQFSNLRSGKTVTSIPIEPSASLRTVFWGDKLLKLSLPQTLNGIDRSVYALQMERAVTISRLLSEIPELKQQQNHFGFLREPAAIAMHDEKNPYGFIIREIPEHIKNGKNTLVSVVSFVSKDAKNGPSLLESHLKIWTGNTSVEKLHNHLITPLIKAFRFAAEEYGILLEAHQQNILLELDADGIFTGRIFYRDLDGARVDVAVRNQLGLSNQWIYSVSNPEWVFQLSQIQKLNETQMGGAENYIYQKYIKGSILSLLTQALKNISGNPNFSTRALEGPADIEMLTFRGCEKFFSRFGNPSSESQFLK